ncbi:kinase-like protein [Rhizophagus irregularis]|uniref:Kinase-like protein n=1 Tax=Rhizophagus irregularis TaxID=588596 RepID=A0A2I1GI61_9GLOM|nr:kinase-like protein [Rhizophagus irregularis]
MSLMRDKINCGIMYEKRKKFINLFSLLSNRDCVARLKILLGDEVSQIVNYYDPQGFKILNKISSGASVLVYNVCWKDTSKFVIKKFIGNSNEEAIINEIHLTGLVNLHPNIIQFYGVTNLKDETNYSLVLEYAEDTIKLADFGRSCLKGSDSNTEVRGVIPYMDPKFFETQNHSYVLTEKSDIYSLGVLLWELTSCKSPFDFETKNNNYLEIIKIKSDILNGKRERPISGTNYNFVTLYKKCWQHEPDERPDIRQVISEINNIENISNDFKIEKIEKIEIVTTEKLENEDVDFPSCDDCDINSDKYNS